MARPCRASTLYWDFLEGSAQSHGTHSAQAGPNTPIVTGAVANMRSILSRYPLARHLFALICALLCLAALVLPSQRALSSTAATPEGAVEAAVSNILRTLNAERGKLSQDPQRVHELLDETIAPYIDFEGMSQLVLGRYWRSATREQRARFVEAFRAFLVRFYATAVEEFIVRQGVPEDLSVSLLQTTSSSDARSARVKTAIQQAGAQPIAVDYTMYRRGDAWRVVDIQVEGISLVVSYRQSFAGEIRNQGLDGLIDRLAATGA